MANGLARCGECSRIEPLFARAVAYAAYDGAMRDLIHLLKYEGVRPAAKVLGRMMSDAVVPIAREFTDELPIVVPVPLHGSKLRERAFNQSELIGREMVRQKPAGLTLELRNDVLQRKRATESQTEYTREQRIRNLRGAFVITNAEKIAGRDVLLVDDVMTTGATVSECTRMLKKAGARTVWVATAARALKPESTFKIPVQQADEQTLSMNAHA